MNIWFASGSADKKKELAAILADAMAGKTLLTPADIQMDFNPEETGGTFCENALLKARELFRRLSCEGGGRRYKKGDFIIADDSGLCVDALGGRPGLHSAIYAGAHGFDPDKKLASSQRNALLLEELGENPLRTARFVCSLVLLVSEDRFYIAQETLEGEIVGDARQAAGTGGFGYDPILFIPRFGKTVAELSQGEKNFASHRGKAGRIISKVLCEIAAQNES
ncbi:MAG: non-canonical purine NTP pyrophosphatase [Spirochaetes bacterium]|nr:non-canonical purine NTP pyrophosphatase [Spirochaetota bacterium]